MFSDPDIGSGFFGTRLGLRSDPHRKKSDPIFSEGLDKDPGNIIPDLQTNYSLNIMVL